MFEHEEGELIISPWEYANLSFSIIDGSVISTTIGFNIWPIHHDYALKELMFSVLNDNLLLGDINNDGMQNILDVVMLVNIVLEGSEGNVAADLNNDGIYNILDVVQLVNLIINN